jgi:AraC-like DNA-binding protein/ligand-binding sensor protein
VKQIAYDDLARLPAIQYYETAFRKATGVSLKLAPPEPTGKRLGFGSAENPFCALVSRSASGCEACVQDEGRLQHGVARKLSSQQIHCFAGLTVVAVPVMVGDRHVASLMTGQVFRREPTQRDFVLVAQMVADGPGCDWEKKLRQSYFETPVVTAERFRAIVELVNVFAQYVADYASRCAIASSPEEPPAVASAKEFLNSHIEHPVSLEQVAQHVNVSPFYFCKLFKKATGMTFTEYMTRIRVEKAKSLLVDPSLRISEVVYAAGFGSIPRFNSVFKRHVGMPPTQYRAGLREQGVL